MKSGNYSLPHPVLGRDDDIKGDFLPLFQYSIERKKIYLSCKVILRNKTLLELVSKGDAFACIQITCSTTKYRKIFELDKNEKIIGIPAKNLRGIVQADFYILSKKKIDGYAPEEMNSDYSSYTFDISEGDILAYDFLTQKFPAEKTWEKLMSVSSFMQVSESPEDKPSVEYNLSEEKIIIYLSKKDFAAYKFLHSNDKLASAFHASIVFPALMVAMNEVMDNSSPYSDKLWFLHLQSKKENDVSLKKIWERQNIPEISQRILDNPISRELTDLDKFIKSESGGEE